jgi:NADH-quinone oxidoreductase subunit C/D
MDPFYTNILEDVKNITSLNNFTFEERNQMSFEQTLEISKEDVAKVMQQLRDQHGFDFMMDLCGVDWPERAKRFDVVYHLLNSAQKKRLRVKVQVGEDESVPTISLIWKGANWFEREAFDMYGIQFAGHPDLRRILTHHEFEGHPLRKDYPADQNQAMSGEPLENIFERDRERLMKKYADEDLMWINIGPAHPATHGTLRFMSVIDGGERIIEMDTEIGYLHRCFEKMCETHNYNQIIPYTDRLNYCSAPMNNSAFCETIEKLLGVKVPPRAQMLRMIIDELSRIMDHYVCVGANLVDLGAITGFFYLFEERELIYTLFEKLCGARLTVSLMRLGGMGFDLPAGWIDECRQVVDKIEKRHAEVEKLVTDNRIFVQRTKGAGIISKETAVQYGFTGPCLRATGFQYDIRKEEPYWFYDEVDFDVPVGSNGDTYDRYLVRMEEVRQSIKILRWCFKNLPEGAISVSDKNITLPSKKDVYGNIEGLMNHFMLIINGVQPPKGEVYHRQEAANGELGFYVISDGTGTPYRVKCRPPCFAILSGFPEMVRGNFLADAVAALGSINIIAGELDR